MKVFCNTTPFIALSSVKQLHLLPTLFGTIHVVDTVVEECAEGGPIAVPDLCHLEWIHIVPSRPCHSLLLLELDRGEKHTLDMAQYQQADRVIIDEKLGRNLAEYLGLRVTGTLGILLKAKQLGLIDSFLGVAQAMRQRGIRYNTALLHRLAKKVGETLPTDNLPEK